MALSRNPFHVLSAKPLTRRRFIAGTGLAVTALALGRPDQVNATDADGFQGHACSCGIGPLRGSSEAPTPIWGYDGLSPGPTLRVKQGEELKVRLINDLDQPTVIHWHGLRLPNAMDGVPHLTQMPIEPGKSFDYRFTPPDAGTFWYHTHFGSSEQLARGLYGVLIVDEPNAPEVDRDLMLVVDDWRLQNDGTIQPSFGNFHDAMMAGRLGQYITLNSQDTLDLNVRTNERIRLRVVNTANSRIFQFRITDHQMRIMAVDGQPCLPEIATNGVVLAPGSRVDFFLDAKLKPNATAAIEVDDLRGGWLPLGRVVYDKVALRNEPLPEPKPLPANPLPAKLDFASALKVDVPIDGGGMSMMMGRGMGGMGGMGGGGPGRFNGYGIPPQERVWALASIASTGHDGPPMFKVKRGRTVALTFRNQTAFAHAMHVHGHHFRHLEGRSDSHLPYWLDTVLVAPDRNERIAFVADNPGKWMIHCHMIEHMATGMAAWFEVT